MNEKILIVDDMTYVRMSLRNYLAKNNFSHLEEAADGVDALKKVNSFKPDIIILDLNLPKISGMNLIELLLNIRPDLKILICSVTNDLTIYEEALNKGALDWIKKPVHEQELIKKINELRNKETKNINTLTIQSTSDYDSEKISIKLNMDKYLQTINLYGKFENKDIHDLTETINGLLPYNYKNIIINFNGVTSLTGDLSPLTNIKNEKLYFVLLKNDSILEKLKTLNSDLQIFKTTLQATNAL